MHKQTSLGPDILVSLQKKIVQNLLHQLTSIISCDVPTEGCYDVSIVILRLCREYGNESPVDYADVSTLPPVTSTKMLLKWSCSSETSLLRLVIGEKSKEEKEQRICEL